MLKTITIAAALIGVFAYVLLIGATLNMRDEDYDDEYYRWCEKMREKERLKHLRKAQKKQVHSAHKAG